MSNNKRNIQELRKTLSLPEKMNFIQASCKYIMKDKEIKFGKTGYKVISHDAVTSMVSEPMTDIGVLAINTCIDNKIESVAGGYMANVRMKCQFFNAVNPDEKPIDVVMPAVGLDPQDKAYGKAISLAVKTIYLKTFLIETGEDEESVFEPNVLAESQIEEIRARLSDAGVNESDFLGFVNQQLDKEYRALEDVDKIRATFLFSIIKAKEQKVDAAAKAALTEAKNAVNN